MAITFLQTQKRQRYLILVLGVVIFAIVIMVWRGFSKKEETLPVLPGFIPQKVEINWQTLKSPQLEALQALATTTPFEGEIGRKNPFIPY